MPTSDDRELIRHARDGDVSAFGELVSRHQARVYRVVLHMLRSHSEAEDVTQNTFVRAFAALAQFDGRSQPYTWFYRIAVNLSLNRLRSSRRTRDGIPVDDPRLEAVLIDSHADAAPEESAERREFAACLCAAIDALSDTLRTTLILVSIDGLSHSEVSTIVGCPEGTVAWRIHEGRRKIRTFLMDHGYGGEGPGHE